MRRPPREGSRPRRPSPSQAAVRRPQEEPDRGGHDGLAEHKRSRRLGHPRGRAAQRLGVSGPRSPRRHNEQWSRCLPFCSPIDPPPEIPPAHISERSSRPSTALTEGRVSMAWKRSGVRIPLAPPALSLVNVQFGSSKRRARIERETFGGKLGAFVRQSCTSVKSNSAGFGAVCNGRIGASIALVMPPVPGWRASN